MRSEEKNAELIDTAKEKVCENPSVALKRQFLRMLSYHDNLCHSSSGV